MRSIEIKTTVQALCDKLPVDLQKQMDYVSEKGASSWVSILSIQDQNFHLHNSLFRDTLCLRCGWEPPRLPSICVCGKPFTVEHGLSCQHGGYPIHWHNDLQNHTASLLSKVCSDVSVKPQLQPLSGEQLTLCSANWGDSIRLDVAATNFGPITVNMLSSTLGSSTPSLTPTTLSESTLAIKSMSRRSNGCMTNK